MTPWMIWATLAVLLVIVELFTSTFYLLMIAFGFVAGTVAAFIGMSLSWQLLVAAVVGSIATIALHKSRYGWKGNADASSDPNVNMDIGQSLQISEWRDAGHGTYVARAMYRGAQWDVELRHTRPDPGLYTIEQVQGSRLIVRPA